MDQEQEFDKEIEVTSQGAALGDEQQEVLDRGDDVKREEEAVQAGDDAVDLIQGEETVKQTGEERQDTVKTEDVTKFVDVDQGAVETGDGEETENVQAAGGVQDTQTEGDVQAADAGVHCDIQTEGDVKAADADVYRDIQTEGDAKAVDAGVQDTQTEGDAKAADAGVQDTQTEGDVQAADAGVRRDIQTEGDMKAADADVYPDIQTEGDAKAADAGVQDTQTEGDETEGDVQAADAGVRRDIQPERDVQSAEHADIRRDIQIEEADIPMLGADVFILQRNEQNLDADAEDDDIQDGDGEDSNMETEEEEAEEHIFRKLSEIPVVVHALDVVWGKYKDVKYSHLLFGSFLDVSEFAVHLAVALAGPCIYRRFQSRFDRMNRYCCVCVDSLETVFPQLRGAPHEVIQHCHDKCQDLWVYVEPVTRPVKNNLCVRTAWSVGKTAFKIGQGAFQVGKTCTWLTCLPAIMCVKVGAFVTSEALKTGLKMMDQVAEQLIVPERDGEGDGLFDDSRVATIEMIEDMLCQVFPAFCQRHEAGRDETQQLSREARQLAEKIYDSTNDKTMFLKVVLSILLSWLLSITTVAVTLIKRPVGLLTGGYQRLISCVDRVWKWCVDLLPDFPGVDMPEDPLQRIGLLIKHLLSTVGRLMVQLAASFPKLLSKCGVMVLESCQFAYYMFDTCTGGTVTGFILSVADYLIHMLDLLQMVSWWIVTLVVGQ